MDLYHKGYFENQEGSNYTGYEDWPQFAERAAWIKKTYNPSSVFELGAAKGYLLKHLNQLGVRTAGIDISEYAASQSEGRVKRGDVTEPLDLGNYDLAVSYDVLEHIPEEKLPALLNNLKTAKAQFHMITTTEYHFGGDDTHVCMQPKAWWVERFKGIPNCTIIHAGEQDAQN